MLILKNNLEVIPPNSHSIIFPAAEEKCVMGYTYITYVIFVHKFKCLYL